MQGQDGTVFAAICMERSLTQEAQELSGAQQKGRGNRWSSHSEGGLRSGSHFGARRMDALEQERELSSRGSLRKTIREAQGSDPLAATV